VPYARRVASRLRVSHPDFTAGVQDHLDCLLHLVVQYRQPLTKALVATGGSRRTSMSGLQEIDEIDVRVDGMQSAGNNQALRDADLLDSNVGAADKPGFALMQIRLSACVSKLR
jgi:uncharacterized protein (DUF2236 family)